MSKFRLKVIGQNQKIRPFMRGILTHSLVQRGMEFEKAYKVAQDVKQRLAKREEILTTELKIIINEEIRKRYGRTFFEKLRDASHEERTPILVKGEYDQQAFSKWLLVKTITAAGIDPDVAYRITEAIQQDLYQERMTVIDSKDLYERIYQKILQGHGEETAEAYHLAMRVNNLDRPVIIYLGGAVGTGKSSLATELATRLGIPKVSGTDTIREIMRIVFSQPILPSLHMSSFEVGELEWFHRMEGPERMIAGYTWQAAKVCVGVQAVVERAIKENINIIIEGVHLLPSLIHYPELEHKAYHIPVVLSLNDRPTHYARFERRQKRAQKREAQRYLENFTNIRTIHDHFIAQANQYDIDIVDNDDFDTAINELVQIVINNLQKQLK